MRERLIAGPGSLSWQPGDPTWAVRARSALISLVGVVDEPWPTAPTLQDAPIQEDGYQRIGVEFPSHEGWQGRGWLLMPERPKGPAVVCLPGHGKGADAIVGLVEEPYQSNFALQCVRRGWVTLAVEQVSFGANRSPQGEPNESSCTVDSMAALLLGQTITGWRVRDAMAARRVLASFPEVDSSRIGALGISGGGLTTLWAAAIDPEFLVAGVSGYFCPMSESILKVYHCPDNYVPGFRRLMDVPDLAGLVAPRWLAVESGSADPLFSAEGFLAACEVGRAVYAEAGVPGRFCSELFEGGHWFNGRGLLGHFERAFG